MNGFASIIQGQWHGKGRETTPFKLCLAAKKFPVRGQTGLVEGPRPASLAGGRVDAGPRFPGCVVSVLQQVGLLLCERLFLSEQNAVPSPGPSVSWHVWLLWKRRYKVGNSSSQAKGWLSLGKVCGEMREKGLISNQPMPEEWQKSGSPQKSCEWARMPVYRHKECEQCQLLPWCERVQKQTHGCGD